MDNLDVRLLSVENEARLTCNFTQATFCTTAHTAKMWPLLAGYLIVISLFKKTCVKVMEIAPADC